MNHFRVALAADATAALGQRGCLADEIAGARKFERIAVQMRQIDCDPDALDVEPWSFADAVARVDRRSSG